MKANQEIHNKVAWYFKWLKTQRNNKHIVEQKESPFRNVNLMDLKLPVKFNELKNMIAHNKHLRKSSNLSMTTAKYIRKAGSVSKKKITILLKRKTKNKIKHAHPKTKDHPKSLRSENIFSCSLDKPDHNSSLFTSGHRSKKSKKRYMSNTTKFWPEKNEPDLKLEKDPHNARANTSHYNVSTSIKNSITRRSFKNSNLKLNKIRISFLDLKGKDLSMPSKRYKHDENKMNKTCTIFGVRNYSLNTPNAQIYKLIESSDTRRTTMERYRPTPDQNITGIEGKSILTQSSVELSPGNQRLGIQRKPPKLQLSSTSYGRKKISSIEIEPKKAKFPELDEFLRMQYIYSQARQRVNEEKNNIPKEEIPTAKEVLPSHKKKISISIKTKLSGIHPVLLKNDNSVESSKFYNVEASTEIDKPISVISNHAGYEEKKMH
ncbi:unnamed protein product [Moneuplotes crassus]|uniref:Uncharacterized protein n=1 Tax=Euplotes crassus TaxID=5936 RepID=A0AAD1Y428_EUPCR|nr:unnamed protein product [Moneuplotes crassus]